LSRKASRHYPCPAEVGYGDLKGGQIHERVHDDLLSAFSMVIIDVRVSNVL
jgi:hypothetical protein